MKKVNKLMDLFRGMTPEGNRKQQKPEQPEQTSTQPVEAETKNGKEEESKVETLTNRVILNEIIKHFRIELQHNSFDDVVTFPMNFIVAMTEEDFDKFKGYMPLIADQTIKKFYQIIKEEMGDSRSCANMATYWVINFIPCVPGLTEVNEKPVTVPEGRVIVLSSVCDTIEKIADSDGQSNVSVTVSGSDIWSNVNINRSLLANFDMNNNARFPFIWDRNMSAGFKPLAQNFIVDNGKETETKILKGTLATLTCDYKGSSTNFMMERNVCIISGSADDRTDATIYKLPCKMVKPGHVSIEYIAKSDKFMLAAYGKTIMNGNEVKLSVGGDVNWVELPENASLNLNGVIMVKFKKTR